jgi:acyl-CoA thioester hydrolase
MEGFPFVFPVEVRFRDLDAMGHVNNAVFLTYLESARIAYWLEVTGRSGLAGMDMILARAEVDYRSPASYRERLEVGVRCASLGRSSFVLEFRVEEVETRRLVAEGRKVLVHYDYAAGRSSPLPPELRHEIRSRDPEARDEAGPPG